MVCILHIDFISLAVLNISTSAQLAFQMGEHFTPPSLDVTSPIEYFPYFEGRYLAVAASLTGGNVLAQFVKMLQQWTHELGKLDELIIGRLENMRTMVPVSLVCVYKNIAMNLTTQT